MAWADSWLVREARRQPILTREQERALARRARSGDAAAVSQLVGSHLRLVIRIADRYRSTGLAKADLVQEGCVGLMQALQRFNPDHDARLATYSMWWIKAAIQDHVMRSWSLVRTGTTAAQKSLFFNLRRLRAAMNETGESLSDAGVGRIAQILGVSERDVRRMEQRLAGPDCSLHGSGRDADEVAWEDRLADDGPTPEQTAIALDDVRVKLAALAAGLAELTQRELEIIRGRYLSAEVVVTLEALGKELGISKERVRQIEARAMAKLRAFMQPVLDGGGAV
ncbi:MAG: RNA polymerase factor sigma-32 [Alphaproteobacteria bacterium]|nr:RNA polymerase factor sigma-32 [Alphaproteobacteria bacterium]MDP6516957.1 RNA polymerase factor sigma-32 [Alphaproteobacteria bacterium]